MVWWFNRFRLKSPIIWHILLSLEALTKISLKLVTKTSTLWYVGL